MCICGKNDMIASIVEISFSSRAMDQGPRLENIPASKQESGE